MSLGPTGEPGAGGPPAQAFRLGDASEVGEARRAAVALAAAAGMDETARGHVALVTTEAATNLVRHATDGVLLLRPLRARGDGAEAEERAAGVELLALDRGPGMADLGRVLRDGVSTAGTAGHGLGAMRRMAHEFDVHTLPGKGTALLARVWCRGGLERRHAAAVEDGVVCLPHPGETVCGDAWLVQPLDDAGERMLVMIADGLGHGPDAAAASTAAVRLVRAQPQLAPRELLERCHLALRATRGAAVAIAVADRGAREVRFAGAGNVAGSIVAHDESRNLASMNGTVGHAIRSVQEFRYPWPAGSSLVLHSDGLTTRWKMEDYPGLIARHPAVLAGVLYRDFARGRDDATVVVLRESPGVGSRV